MCAKIYAQTRNSSRELFADERCSKVILDFLATTEVGRTAGPPVADAARPRSGKRENARNPCTGGGGGGGRLGGAGLSSIVSFSFVFAVV